MTPDNNKYIEDVLKDGFEQHTIPLQDDSEGCNVATLIRRLSPRDTDKAVLYIHGFNDYFFQAEMAHEFNDHGYNFYALDLRKYGRSYLPHQTKNDIRNLDDYFEEIEIALHIIRQEGNEHVALFGHSTGGLILTLFAKSNRYDTLFDVLILNSPFFEFNKSALLKAFIPLATFVGKYFPNLKISGGLSEEYGKSIHHSFDGEWDYGLQWKPNMPPKVKLGWVRAIYMGQQQLKKHIIISKPLLVLHSARSTTNFKDSISMHSCDAILNVRDIACIANKMEGRKDIIAIDGGLHDLVLSAKDVRRHVYDVIFGWLSDSGL